MSEIDVTFPEGKEVLNKKEVLDLFLKPYAEMCDKAFGDYNKKIQTLESEVARLEAENLEMKDIIKEHQYKFLNNFLLCVGCGVKHDDKCNIWCPIAKVLK